MILAAGRVQYELGTVPVTGCGITFCESELDSALKGPVAAALFDDSGKADVRSMLMEVADSDFEKEKIEEILVDAGLPENWRVGEALAEVYLSQHRNCYFPWSDGRDERNRGSSLPGADLAGFQFDGESTFFAFGEVKTSAEKRYPPGVVYGRTGLKQQIENLKSSDKTRSDLVLYLGHRATNASWKSYYQQASKQYLKSTTNVRIFGLLVRDVEPSKDDLQVRVARLAQGECADMIIELLALYLPLSSIEQLGNKVVESRRGGVE